MLNPSTNRLPQDELNHCTAKLAGGWRTVRLRNGTEVKARAFTVTGDHEMYIWSTNRAMMWNLDGTSVTSDGFDIMEVL